MFLLLLSSRYVNKPPHIYSIIASLRIFADMPFLCPVIAQNTEVSEDRKE
jgi:hypothetical protein